MSAAPWFLPSIAAVLLWGISTFLPKLVVRRLPPLHMTVYSCGFFMIGCIVMQGFYGFHVDFNARGALLGCSVGVIGAMAQILYNTSLRDSTMTYSVVITSLYPAVAALLAFLILGEHLTARQIAGIVLGMLALILMVKASDGKTDKE